MDYKENKEVVNENKMLPEDVEIDLEKEGDRICGGGVNGCGVTPIIFAQPIMFIPLLFTK